LVARPAGQPDPCLYQSERSAVRAWISFRAASATKAERVSLRDAAALSIASTIPRSSDRLTRTDLPALVTRGSPSERHRQPVLPRHRHESLPCRAA
jgi:hypothetical protein